MLPERLPYKKWTEFQVEELPSDPDTPGSSNWQLYFKAGGLYFISDAGVVTGPLSDAGGAPGGSDTQVQFNDGGALGGDASFKWDKTNNRLSLPEIRALDGNGLKLYDDGGNGIFVKDGGNVGIGTTSPGAKLDIGGHLSGTAAPFTSVGATALISADINNITGVGMRNVNTGTSADFRFTVSDTTDNYLAFSVPSTGNTGGNLFGLSRSTTAFIFNGGGTVRDIAIGTLGDKDLVLGTNNTARVTIKNNGNVGIGTTDQFGGGTGVIGLANAGAVPGSNPTGGGVLYAQNGVLKWRGSAGTVTSIAVA